MRYGSLARPLMLMFGVGSQCGWRIACGTRGSCPLSPQRGEGQGEGWARTTSPADVVAIFYSWLTRLKVRRVYLSLPPPTLNPSPR